ncbi:hypothetical protein TA3x_003272 [Tundrisphaera sp. TA3]|uniref:hypothetical protein n=1 Tax=Tundrisphaera sp. TA3 TaxID=3435775 RepID=UPI003EBED89D
MLPLLRLRLVGLDIVELVMAIESTFGINIPNEVAPTLETLGDIERFVIQALQERGSPVDHAEVWSRITAIMKQDFGIAADRVRPDAHLVDDLGLD